MKITAGKIITVFMAMIIIMCQCTVSASAETIYRDAFSFCELYTQRLMNFEKSTNSEIADISDYYFNEINAPLGTVNCCAGSISLNPDDWSVSEFMTEIYASYGTNPTRIMSAIIAISCLEYNVSDETTLKYIKKTDPITMAYSIYSEHMSMYTTSIGIRKLDKNEPVKVYEGNYTYYLRYFKASSDTEIIYLIAK